MSDEKKKAERVGTSGGAYVGGDAQAGRDFVGRDQIVINVTWQAAPFDLGAQPDLDRLRADYLVYLRQAYQYLDFKGLPQVEKIAQQLPLDAVYVPLHARPELPKGETWPRVAGRAWKGEDLAAKDARALDREPRATEPLPVDEALGEAPALVILGDPGAGKSTLLKVLALALARQADGPLPILLPLNAYAAALQEGEINLHDFFARYFATRQRCLKDLGPLFEAALAAGQAVVLLDGLDEVQAQRAFLVRLVEDFARANIPAAAGPASGNRLLVTSRIVGYRETPLSGPGWRIYTLVDFRREEIERFADRWTRAFEVAVHGDSELTRQAARQERDELLASVFANPGIERLASNPLLLTILALIKRQGVSLPQRRVELYELYLRTLINAWNKARALDQRPVGSEMDYLETVQVLAPLGLWLRETNPTAGLVGRAALENWVSNYYRREWELSPGPARQQARRFLRAVRHYSNLLVERGPEQYGFLHLTFEEMLAAKGIAAQAQLGPDAAVETITRHLGDPAWRETILLAVGALGVVAQQPLAAGAVLRGLCAATLEGDAQGQNVLVAGEALLDVGEVGVGRQAAAQVTRRLVETMQATDMPARARRQAGLILGRLGWAPDDLEAFVEIPPGPFLYGDGRERRKIQQRYWIGKYPLTNAQFARFVADGGYRRRELWDADGWDWRKKEKRERPGYWDDSERNNPIFPVVGVTWFEAQAFCRWLTGSLSGAAGGWPEGCVARLPAEGEWERAARGTHGREFPWGDEFEVWRANTGEDDVRDTTAVCTYPQGVNSDGLWDAAGNVWEWTTSRWESTGRRRVVRGGSWVDHHGDARCAYRGGGGPDDWSDALGFRVVVSLALLSAES